MRPRAGPLQLRGDRDDIRVAAATADQLNGQRQTVTIGGRRDGTLLAYRLDILADAGAYPHDAWLPSATWQRPSSGPTSTPW